MKGRIDQLAINGADLLIRKGASNLGLSGSLTESISETLRPILDRAAADHFPADSITLEGALERVGLLKKRKEAIK